ncbi:glycosyltransferase [Nocardioides sp.]|uniref:glycosyltransferase n=1 Tax=Nocardioides sp. TaxID=35761 RepID=UPI0035ADA536
MTAVSVLMPVAAPAPHLREALESVLAQSHEDWTLVLINDGDDPVVRDLATALIPRDRLTLVPIMDRRGLSYALNCGLDAARTELVARLDADDIADPDRLANQSDFMDRAPTVVLTGMAARLIDESGAVIGRRDVVVEDEAVQLLARNQFIHPAVMYRRSAVRAIGGYDVSCSLREDYDLWLRLAAMGEVRNLDTVGIDYRISSAQVSRRPVEWKSVRIVGRSQAALGRTLGRSRFATLAQHLKWAVAQHPVVQRLRRTATSGASS